jgi:hypothetical protein
MDFEYNFNMINININLNDWDLMRDLKDNSILINEYDFIENYYINKGVKAFYNGLLSYKFLNDVLKNHTYKFIINKLIYILNTGLKNKSELNDSNKLNFYTSLICNWLKFTSHYYKKDILKNNYNIEHINLLMDYLQIFINFEFLEPIDQFLILEYKIIYLPSGKQYYKIKELKAIFTSLIFSLFDIINKHQRTAKFDVYEFLKYFKLINKYLNKFYIDDIFPTYEETDPEEGFTTLTNICYIYQNNFYSCTDLNNHKKILNTLKYYKNNIKNKSKLISYKFNLIEYNKHLKILQEYQKTNPEQLKILMIKYRFNMAQIKNFDEWVQVIPEKQRSIKIRLQQ